MPAIQGYSIRHISGTKVTIGPGSAVADGGGTIDNPNDIEIDVLTDKQGTIDTDSLLAIYVIKEGGKVSGIASASFDGVMTSGKYRRVGAVRLTPANGLAEGYQANASMVRPTKYTDPHNDTTFSIPKTNDFGLISLVKYAPKGTLVEVAITAALPNNEVVVKAGGGSSLVVIGAGILKITTSPQGSSEFHSKDGEATITVLGFEDVV